MVVVSPLLECWSVWLTNNKKRKIHPSPRLTEESVLLLAKIRCISTMFLLAQTTLPIHFSYPHLYKQQHDRSRKHHRLESPRGPLRRHLHHPRPRPLLRRPPPLLQNVPPIRRSPPRLLQELRHGRNHRLTLQTCRGTECVGEGQGDVFGCQD